MSSDRVTYIKPEVKPNLSLSSVQSILHLGTKAAQQKDWVSLGDYLKQLPQRKNTQKAPKFELNKENWDIALNLAISTLLEADFQHKWSIIKLLPWFGSNIIPTLINLVKDTTVEVDTRGLICQTLGNFSQSEVVLTLVELLDSATDRELKAIAGKTLTAIGDDAVDALQELLAKPQHRILAVRSLYYIRTVKTIEPLLDITQDSDPNLRAIALKALGSFHDARIAPVLIRALQDKASDVRKEAATALGFRPELNEALNLVEHLCPLLYDYNLEVCSQAAISLSRIKNKAATTALFKVLRADTTPIELKVDVVKALGWSETSSSIDYLAKTLSVSPPRITSEIIVVLGRISKAELKTQAAEKLVEFWDSRSSQLELLQVKQALTASLGELRCGKRVLEQLAKDSDRKVKLYATSALKKISTR